MREEFLHYLWKYRLYDENALLDSNGNLITVLNPGEYNRDAGPDFFNARIKIDELVWAGNIEIHTKASFYDQHRHNSDRAYDNIILHVVAENDKKVCNSNGEEILTVELRFDHSMYNKYHDLINNPYLIACQLEVASLDKLFLHQWMAALVAERLHGKTENIRAMLISTGNNWEEVVYRLVARYFGLRVNSDTFELLAKSLPSKIILKHADNLLQVEAMLFGTAGLLDSEIFKDRVNDSYYKILLREFKVLSSKYSLKPIHGWLWKFARLRPANFPTVRIAQLARLLTVSGGLFSRITGTDDIDELRRLFAVSASAYWNDHYVFGKKSIIQPKNLGPQAIEMLIINVVVPILFVHGSRNGDVDIGEKVLKLLEDMVPEKNAIVSEWREAGITALSAFETQALIQLRNDYCKKRRCIECRIGCRLIGQGKPLINQNMLLLEP